MYKFYILLLFPILVFSQDTISKPQNSVISLDKVKIVYRGIDNPITVAVPNAKEYWVSGPGVSKTDELGKYKVRPGSGTELKIVVAIKLQDDSIVTEEHVYQIKNFPNPKITINGEYSTQNFLKFKLDELKDAIIAIKYFDFTYDNYIPDVKKFTLKVPGHETLSIEGNTFTEEVYSLLKRAKKRDFIIIANVQEANPIYFVTRSVRPIIFQIVK